MPRVIVGQVAKLQEAVAETEDSHDAFLSLTITTMLLYYGRLSIAQDTLSLSCIHFHLLFQIMSCLTYSVCIPTI